MTWWVFSLLHNYRPPHYLRVLAVTRQKTHMFIRWWKTKPARHMIYRNIRGTPKWCGYKYLWTGSHLHEQNEPDDSYNHTFGPIPLQPADPVWYYLFSYFSPGLLEHQGPLIYVPPPEVGVPAARIYNSTPQTIPRLASTVLTFDSVLYDDLNFYDPAEPDRLTLPMGGLFAFGCSIRYATTLPMGMRTWIHLAGGPQFVSHSHYVNGNNWPGCSITMQTITALRPGDALQVSTYHSSANPRDVQVDPLSSPHFWIAQIGAYPVSPP